MIDKEQIVPVFKTIFDPDLYIDIWTLGLIYDYQIVERSINVKMTFTSPACPAAPQLIGEIKQRLGELEGVEQVNVEVVFQPPWEPSEDLKALMGL
jgi:metal-sulfur cluster biosynthetic enzyme